MELLGEMPKTLALSGKYSHEMFNRRGKFLNSTIPPPCLLVANLSQENYATSTDCACGR